MEIERKMGGLALQYAQAGLTRSPRIVHISFAVSVERRLESKFYIMICSVARRGRIGGSSHLTFLLRHTPQAIL